MEIYEEPVGLTLFRSEKFGGVLKSRGGCSPTLRAEKVCAGLMQTEDIYDKALNCTPKDGTIKGGDALNSEDGKRIRIRKLTPLE